MSLRICQYLENMCCDSDYWIRFNCLQMYFNLFPVSPIFSRNGADAHKLGCINKLFCSEGSFTGLQEWVLGLTGNKQCLWICTHLGYYWNNKPLQE